VDGSTAAAEGKDEVEDGASCDVEFACGLLVWPVIRASGGKGEVKEEGKANDSVMINIHLPASEDEALLWRRNAGLLLDFLLDPGDLQRTKNMSGGEAFRKRRGCVRGHAVLSHLIIEIDVKLDLGRCFASTYGRRYGDEGNLPLCL
jgi:hypothetical protein